MAKEKLTSVKILQTTVKKRERRIPIYLIFGGIFLLIILGCIVLRFTFFKPFPSTPNNVIYEDQVTQTPTAEPKYQGSDENDYRNQVNDQQISSLFKHTHADDSPLPQVKSTESHSPFAIFSNAKPPSAPQNTIQPERLVNPKLSTTLPLVRSSKKNDEQRIVKPALLSQLNIDKELEKPNSDSSPNISEKSKEE